MKPKMWWKGKKARERSGSPEMMRRLALYSSSLLSTWWQMASSSYTKMRLVAVVPLVHSATWLPKRGTNPVWVGAANRSACSTCT